MIPARKIFGLGASAAPCAAVAAAVAAAAVAATAAASAACSELFSVVAAAAGSIVTTVDCGIPTARNATFHNATERSWLAVATCRPSCDTATAVIFAS